MAQGLFLHSDQVWPQSREQEEALVLCAGSHPVTMAYIPSSSDKKRRYFDEKKDYYAGFGIELFYCDLDEEFDNEVWKKALSSQAIHLAGGHTGRFLQILQKRKALNALRKYASEGGILVGVSAGAILLTSTIRIASSLPAIDRETAVPSPEALQLVDFEFYPHFGDEGSATPDEIQAYARRLGRRVLACSDGSGVAVIGDKEIHFGDVREFQPGSAKK